MAGRHSIKVATWLGIVIMLSGILVPIAWDQLRVRVAIELRNTAFSTIVERGDVLQKLAITYAGQELQRVSKADFVLINTGNTAITASELFSPPQIVFAADTPVLDVVVEEVSPANLAVNVALDRDKNVVTISFPLLNKRDYIRFSVLTSASTVAYAASARIQGVHELQVVRLQVEKSHAQRRAPAGAYVVAVFASLVLLAGLKGTNDVGPEKRMKRAAASGRLDLPKSELPAVYLQFVDTKLAFTTIRERRPLRNLIASFPAGTPLDDVGLQRIEEGIRALLATAVPNLPACVVMIMLGLGGWIYPILAFLGRA